MSELTYNYRKLDTIEDAKKLLNESHEICFFDWDIINEEYVYKWMLENDATPMQTVLHCGV